jgi:copper chaperone CopZ
MKSLFTTMFAALFLLGLSFPALGAEPAPAKPAKDAVTVLKLSNLTDATKDVDVKKLEAAVKKVAGVKKVAADKKKGELTVTAKADLDQAALKKAVTDAGFTIFEPKADAPAAEPAPAPAPAPAPQPAPAK